jgi:hypothetical protein
MVVPLFWRTQSDVAFITDVIRNLNMLVFPRFRYPYNRIRSHTLKKGILRNPEKRFRRFEKASIIENSVLVFSFSRHLSHAEALKAHNSSRW